jgi:hypothetical protein
VKAATDYLQSKDWWTADKKPGGRKRASVVLDVSSWGSEKARAAAEARQGRGEDEVLSSDEAFKALQGDKEGDKQLTVYLALEAIRPGKTDEYIPLQETQDPMEKLPSVQQIF